MKLGKFPARIDRRTVLFKDVAPSLPKPPEVIDWLNGQEDWGVMANDRLGDCTCAALGHAEQTITANCVGFSEFTPTDQQVVELYSASCGYVPGHPNTDQGGYGMDVLKYVRKNDLFGKDSLIGFAVIHADDTVRVRQAIAAFGGVYVGLQLPNSVCQDDMLYASWDFGGKITPNTNNGHMVWIAKANSVGPVPITWGITKQMSWAFWLACADEVYVPYFSNWLAQYGNLPQAREAMQNALEGIT
jgi:drug/metabolite transporter superfamily protein YnfA